MARRTLTERITKLEARRDSIETKLEKHESYKSLKGQGTEGAETDFTDPTKLNNLLREVEDKLADLYNQQRFQ